MLFLYLSQLIIELIRFAFLVLHGSLQSLLGYFDFFDLAIMLELRLLHSGFEVSDFSILLHQLYFQLDRECDTNSVVSSYSSARLIDRNGMFVCNKTIRKL